MPEIHLEDTIAAIATPPGEGGIGVIRISGPEAINIANQIFRKRHSSVILSPSIVILNEVKDLRAGSAKNLQLGDPSASPQDDMLLIHAKSHTVHYGTVVDDANEAIDQVLVSVFRKPKSYTAEDIIEISGHGGSRVLQKILDLILNCGARHAEPGEFTRRAFLNGRIDLTQAEAVLDLIRAKTDKSVEVALRQLDGNLSRHIQALKNELMKVYAHLEAYLDFPDEHLEVYSDQDFKSRFEKIQDQLKMLIDSYREGAILREGASVVLCGKPNVGKSSLLNALLDQDRALVSEVPGTTRDTIEESVELGGILVRLVDTAGLWTSQNPLDQAAMERTKRYFEEGDLILWVVDAQEGVGTDDLRIFEQIRNKKVVGVFNKSDLIAQKKSNGVAQYLDENKICFVSAKTGEGIDHLEKKIAALILDHGLGQESVLITRLRHKHALEQSLAALNKSFEAFLQKESLEFIALDLKQSLDALKELVGEIYSEDLLDVIFQEFCIGK